MPRARNRPEVIKMVHTNINTNGGVTATVEKPEKPEIEKPKKPVIKKPKKPEIKKPTKPNLKRTKK